MQAVQAALYGPARIVLSPSASVDASLAGLGIAAERIACWERGVDLTRFGPARRGGLQLPGRINVLYAGRLTKEKGADLLAESFEAALATGACTWCLPAADPRRSGCDGGSVRMRRFSAGCKARCWPTRMRAPTCSCSARGPIPTAR